MAEENVQTDARLGRALVALQKLRGAVSAKAWAKAAGIAEGEVPKIVEELRAMGVPIQGSQDGWRLTGEADVPLAEVLEPKIGDTVFAGNVHHFVTVGSTNSAAMRAGVADFGPNADGHATYRGAVWLAEEQTAGKGRAGHTWKSDPGDGIYCSALLRPRLTPTDAITLSLVAGLAVVQAVHEVTGLWADLRWPNDVMMGGKKFCGILTELNAEFSRVRFVVIGMGLNVNNAAFPPELEPIATSLRMEAGRKFSRVELVAALLRALDREQRALEQGVDAARENILRRFEKHSSYCCNCAVTVEEDGGYDGITRGLDERGFLRVESQGVMRTVLSGGVRKR